MQAHARDSGLLLLRVVFGGVLAFAHGLGKVREVLSGSFQFADPLGIGAAPSLVLAAAGEFVFGLLVLAGAWTRWTAVPPALTMAVAFFVFHAGDPFGQRELALLYLMGLVAIILLGPGRYSVDGWRSRR